MSSLPTFPQSVSDFIARYIKSVEQLEILLLLSRAPDVQWTEAEVYKVILSTQRSVARWLDDLSHAGLVLKVASADGSGERYQGCADEALVREISLLAEAYRNTPVRVFEAIYTRESKAVQSFADAFRIKQPDKS